MTVRKIKITDIDEIRKRIDSVYENQSQIILARWSLEIARHIIEIIGLDTSKYPEVEEGFSVNEMWQNGNARMHDVRQAGFKIHKIAREQNDEELSSVFRVIGQAVSSGHMREHAMVASDYAIKVINIRYGNDITKVQEERNWQLEELLRLSN